jgi:hypothetical protein
MRLGYRLFIWIFFTISQLFLRYVLILSTLGARIEKSSCIPRFGIFGDILVGLTNFPPPYPTTPCQPDAKCPLVACSRTVINW